MRNRISLPTDEAVFTTVEQFVQQALAGGCNPAELSCALNALAVRIGFDLAVSSGNSLGVRMRVGSDAVAESSARQTSQHADLDTGLCCKRKSDRAHRSNSIVADRQRSRDISELGAAFRRCHSDSEFRARFIANCRSQ